MRRALAAAAVIGLVACGQVASAPTGSVPSAKPFKASSTWGLFVTSYQSFQHEWSLTRLNPESLKDIGATMPGHGYAIASADGSTLVEVDYNNDTTAVRVIDARNGAVRAAFQPSFASAPVLTPDGSRLLVSDNTGHSYRVFDTANGQVTGKLETGDAPCCGLFNEWLDPTGSFLYGIDAPGSGMYATGPVTPVLVRYDLRAGRENGRLALTGVLAGVWQTDRTIGSEHVTTMLSPGAALSSDGSQLSVLSADSTHLVTIDAIEMRIVSSRRVAEPSPATSWFSLWPIDAYAKYDAGVQWSLVYSPDGRKLVASGRETSIDQSGNRSTRGLGVKLIDVQSASLLAAAPDLDAGLVFFAPDGSALYAMAWVGDQAHAVLLRLDPSSLAVAARREFSEPRDVLILAS